MICPETNSYTNSPVTLTNAEFNAVFATIGLRAPIHLATPLFKKLQALPLPLLGIILVEKGQDDGFTGP